MVNKLIKLNVKASPKETRKTLFVEKVMSYMTKLKHSDMHMGEK